MPLLHPYPSNLLLHNRYLAREGVHVDVYERREEPRADSVDNGRAYIIILVPRGKAALEEVGSL